MAIVWVGWVRVEAFGLEVINGGPEERCTRQQGRQQGQVERYQPKV